MRIEDYLVMEIEHNYSLLADVRGSTALIWQKGFKPTEHSLNLDGTKALSSVASELVAEHYQKDKSELTDDIPNE